MVEIIGQELAVPSINLTGYLSGTWIYVLVAFLVGLLLVVTVSLVMFFKTYNRKIVFFEDIAGRGLQPVMKKRARVIRIGKTGEELLKVMGTGYMSAYGRKMGKNTYWFVKGQDGYWYNVLVGDLDAKQGILDIDPVDKDVRMFHTATAKLNEFNYGQQKFMEKYGQVVIGITFIIIMSIIAWILLGKAGKVMENTNHAMDVLTDSMETNKQLSQLNINLLEEARNLDNGNSGSNSGLTSSDNLSGS